MKFHQLKNKDETQMTEDEKRLAKEREIRQQNDPKHLLGVMRTAASVIQEEIEHEAPHPVHQKAHSILHQENQQLINAFDDEEEGILILVEED